MSASAARCAASANGVAVAPELAPVRRRTLYLQFKIRDNDVFEKALGYVREYY